MKTAMPSMPVRLHLSVVPAGAVNEPPTNRQEKRIQRAIEYIQKHYREHISPEALSLEVDLSVAKLQAGMKAATGRTVASYVELTRIDESKTLLANSDLSVRNIAKEVGFKTQSHFGDVFKKLTGHTPLQYRNRYGC